MSQPFNTVTAPSTPPSSAAERPAPVESFVTLFRRSTARMGRKRLARPIRVIKKNAVTLAGLALAAAFALSQRLA